VQRQEGAVGIVLQPVAAAPGQPQVDLSLERWSLQACADVVRDSCGLELRVPEH
jgi:hypothetical protein